VAQGNWFSRVPEQTARKNKVRPYFSRTKNTGHSNLRPTFRVEPDWAPYDPGLVPWWSARLAPVTVKRLPGL